MKLPENIVAGSIKAEMNGCDLKVKEKLRGVWSGDGKLIRFNVVGFTVPRIPGYGILNIKYETGIKCQEE